MKQSWRLAKWDFFRLRQIQVGNPPPQADRQIADQRLLDFAEPPHEPGHGQAWNAVGEQEIDVFLHEKPFEPAGDRHVFVNFLR